MEPYSLGRRLRLGTDLYWTEKTYLSDFYDQRDFGGAINLHRPFGDNSDLRFGYTLQEVEIYDISDTGFVAEPALQAEEGDFLQSRLSASYVYDNRDSIQLPTRGHKITLEAMMSGGFLGGDVDTYTVSLAGQKHWKLPWKGIFSLDGKVIVVDDIDDNEVPIFERQFLGGANNLRGWDYREVGPQYEDPAYDSFGEPRGGNTAAYITAEYTFPIVRRFRGALFADAGFVNEDSWDFSTSDFAADVGLGVRFVLPMLGPIKLDYGFPVRDGVSKDSSGQFHFSMDYKW
jgi:outer membrane protein insertion porin family